MQELVLRIGADKYFITGYPRKLRHRYQGSFFKRRDQYNNIILYTSTWRHGDNL